MKALIQAINNLASSIASLANSISNKEKIELKDNKSKFITKTKEYPFTPVEKNIDFSYNTYGSLSLDEREALYKIYKAVFNKGINEPLHDKILSNLLNDLKRDWPSLYSAFDTLIKSKTKKYTTRHFH